jgi:hypothetical protein
MKNSDHIFYFLAATIMLEKITVCMILTGLSDELSVCWHEAARLSFAWGRS